MRYSDSFIEEVRQSSHIVDVISGYIKLKKTGNSYMGLCPFHHEKSPSFSVSADKQMYYCFGCGVGGNVLTFIMEYENYSFIEALTYLAERSGIKMEAGEETAEQKKWNDEKSLLLEIHRLAARYYYAQLRNERGKGPLVYLHQRGLSDGILKKFGVGYAGNYGDMYAYLKDKGFSDELLKQSGLFVFREDRGVLEKFYNRIMFPIFNINHKVIGFGGRVLDSGKPKYLNSPETKLFDKSKTLYGLHLARTSREKQFIICEGYMDVLSLHQAGFENAVAALGTAFTAQHAIMLKRYTDKAVIAFDSDEAGQKAALRAIPLLKEAGIAVKVMDMRPHKDPDEYIKGLGADSFRQRIQQAEGSFLYEVRVLEQQHDLNNPESKTGFYHEIARKILGFPEEIERNNYIEAIDRQYHVGFDNLKRLVNQLGASAYTAVSVRQENVVGPHKKKTEEDGLTRAQKLLITWLVKYTYLFDKIEGYIAVSDFKEPIFAKVAGRLFEQYHTSGTVTPAQIISEFVDIEEQKKVAAMFNMDMIEEMDTHTLETALNEVVIRIKKHSLEMEGNSISDLSALQKNMSELAKLQNLHISL